MSAAEGAGAPPADAAVAKKVPKAKAKSSGKSSGSSSSSSSARMFLNIANTRYPVGAQRLLPVTVFFVYPPP
jgi:hypothetical protein